MFKPTPNPPEAEAVSPYQFPDSRPPLNDATERALDHYLPPQQRIMGSHHKHDPMFLANSAYDSESLLANTSESLSSVTEMLNNFAAILEPTHRKTAFSTAQVFMVAGLAVNQALDNVEPKKRYTVFTTM